MAPRAVVFGRGYYVSRAQRALVKAFADAVRAEARSLRHGSASRRRRPALRS